MTAADQRVCPRCGEPATEQRFCATCGLNLAKQLELPTLEEYTARQREEAWLRAHPGSETSNDPSEVPASQQLASPPAPSQPEPASAAPTIAGVTTPPPPPNVHSTPAPPLTAQRLATLYWIMFAGLALAVISFVVYAIEGLRWVSDVNDLLSGNVAAGSDGGAARSAVDGSLIFVYVANAVACIPFLIWFFMAYKNLDWRGIGLRFTRGWAIGSWFVPFLNLARPKQIANDIWRWRDLAPEGFDHSRSPVTPMLHWWWALYLGASALWAAGIVMFQTRVGVTDTWADVLHTQRTGFWISFAGVAAWIGAAVLIAIAAYRITQAEDHFLSSSAPSRT